MKVVIDAIPVVPFGGYAVALENMLAGWDRLDSGDEVHVLVAEGDRIELPASMQVHDSRRQARGPATGRRPVRWRRGRSAGRSERDVLLGALPTTALIDVGCPKVITVYDLRHELLPEQFSGGRRLLRRLSYGIGYRQAAAHDLHLGAHAGRPAANAPRAPSKNVVSVLFAADHVDDWPRDEPQDPESRYALAFGHFPNKAVERVLDAWEILNERGAGRPLVFVGLPSGPREAVAERIRAAGLHDLVTLLPWLDDEEFKRASRRPG